MALKFKIKNIKWKKVWKECRDYFPDAIEGILLISFFLTLLKFQSVLSYDPKMFLTPFNYIFGGIIMLIPITLYIKIVLIHFRKKRKLFKREAIPLSWHFFGSRNPFLTLLFLFFIGVLIINNSWINFILLIILFGCIFYLYARYFKEKRIKRRVHAVLKVPLFFPKLSFSTKITLLLIAIYSFQLNPIACNALLDFVQSEQGIIPLLSSLIASQSAILGIAIVIFVIFVQIAVPKFSLKLTKVIVEDKRVLFVLASYLLSIGVDVIFLGGSAVILQIPTLILLPISHFFLNLVLLIPAFRYVARLLSFEHIVLSLIDDIDENYALLLSDIYNCQTKDLRVPTHEDLVYPVEEVLLKFIDEEAYSHFEVTLGTLYYKFKQLLEKKYSPPLVVRLKKMSFSLLRRSLNLNNDTMCKEIIKFLNWILKIVQDDSDKESEEIIISHLKSISSQCLDGKCWESVDEIIGIIGRDIRKKNKALPSEDNISTFLIEKYPNEPEKWHGANKDKTFESSSQFDDFIYHDLGFFHRIGVNAARAKNESIPEIAIWQLKHLLYEIPVPVVEKKKFGHILSFVLLYIKYIYDAMNEAQMKLSVHGFDFFIGELIRRDFLEEAWAGLGYFCEIFSNSAKKGTIEKFELNSLGSLARGYASDKRDKFLEKVLDTMGLMALIYKKKRQFELYTECRKQIESASSFSKGQIEKVNFWLEITENPLGQIGSQSFAEKCTQYKPKEKDRQLAAECPGCLNYELCSQTLWI